MTHANLPAELLRDKVLGMSRCKRGLSAIGHSALGNQIGINLSPSRQLGGPDTETDSGMIVSEHCKHYKPRMTLKLNKR